MHPLLVVPSHMLLDVNLHLPQARKEPAVQELIAQATVEAVSVSEPSRVAFN